MTRLGFQLDRGPLWGRWVWGGDVGLLTGGPVRRAYVHLRRSDEILRQGGSNCLAMGPRVKLLLFQVFFWYLWLSQTVHHSVHPQFCPSLPIFHSCFYWEKPTFVKYWSQQSVRYWMMNKAIDSFSEKLHFLLDVIYLSPKVVFIYFMNKLTKQI